MSDVHLKMIDGRRLRDSFYVAVESLSIPRGGMHPCDKRPIVTAIREFVEETNLSIENIIVYDEHFNLWWRDDDQVYHYTIFVGLLCGDTPLVRHPVRYEYIHRPRFGDETTNTIALQRHRENRFEEKRHVLRITFKDYVNFMKKYQLDTYTESNYGYFFNFIKNIDFFSKKRWTKYKLFFSHSLSTMTNCIRCVNGTFNPNSATSYFTQHETQ